MKSTRTCGRCGSAVPAFAPDQLCLHCLFDTANGEEGLPSRNPLFSLPQNKAGEPSLPSQTFGDYELLEELGRGGQGVVYRARHLAMGRIVALKTIPPAGLSSARARERFRFEAATASQLDHPNIVPVYEAGEVDGFYYYSMKLMTGGTIEQAGPCSANGADLIRRAPEQLILVARAVHHAHQRGVLHRDLKPSNVLLDSEGQPYVSDFGLARGIGDDSSLTLTGGLMGTPAFLAPEVAARGTRHATVASDIYSLGAVLYHLLTGRPPFLGDSLAATLRALQESEPVPIVRLNAAISEDLQTICFKCLEKDPAKRYATAQDLADDLERFLADKPIHAHPITRVERFGRWCRRKPALAGSLAAVALLLLVVILGSPIAAYRINKARQGEIAAKTLAKAEAESATKVLRFLTDDLLVFADPFRAAGSELAAGREISLRTAVQQAVLRIGSRFQHEPLVEADIRLTIGRAFLRLNELDLAEEQLRKASDIYSTLLPADAEQALAARHEWGLLLVAKGQRDDAFNMLRDVLTNRQCTLGPRHLETLNTMTALAMVYQEDVATCPAAENLFKEVLRLGKPITKESAEVLTRAMSGLSSLYQEQLRFDESRQLENDILRLRRATLSPDHPDLIEAELNHAYHLRYREGAWAAADALGADVLDRSIRVLGPYHPITLFAMVERNFRDEAKGLGGNAVSGFHQVLDFCRKKYGARDSLTFWSEDLLGGSLRRHGDYPEAESIHRATMNARLMEGPSATVAGQRSTRYLAVAAYHQGRVSEAESLYMQVMADSSKAYGGDNSRTLYNTRLFCDFLGKQAKWDEFTQIYLDRAPLNTHIYSLRPLAQLPLSSGIVAAVLAGREAVARHLTEVLLDRFGRTTNHWARAEIARSCLALPAEWLNASQQRQVAFLVQHAVAQSNAPITLGMLSGMAAYRAGRPAEALDILRPLAENPDNHLAALAGYFLAMASSEMGRSEAASQSLLKANQRLAIGLRPGLLGHRGQADFGYETRYVDYARCLCVRDQAERLVFGKIESPPIDFQALASLREDWRPFQTLLNEFERQGARRNWRAARDALVKTVDQGSINWEPEGNFVNDLFQKAAAVLALTGEVKRYRTLVAGLIDHADLSQSYYNVALFMTRGLPSTAPAKAIEMARWAAGQKTGDWTSLQAGLAEYRAGHFQAAQTALEPALKAFNLNCAGSARVVASLAAYQRNLRAEAQSLLDEAESLLTRVLEGNPDHLGPDWQKTAFFELLLGEARTIIKKTEPSL